MMEIKYISSALVGSDDESLESLEAAIRLKMCRAFQQRKIEQMAASLVIPPARENYSIEEEIIPALCGPFGRIMP